MKNSIKPVIFKLGGWGKWLWNGFNPYFKLGKENGPFFYINFQNTRGGDEGLKSPKVNDAKAPPFHVEADYLRFPKWYDT